MRYLAKSSGVPGDYPGQTSMGMRMPYGGVSVITPFNFPLEICALQARPWPWPHPWPCLVALPHGPGPGPRPSPNPDPDPDHWP